jgi:replicative superfamily II helicase
MIDDGYRGYILELMATKLLCLDQQVQVIAMSATLTVRFPPNIPGDDLLMTN